MKNIGLFLAVLTIISLGVIFLAMRNSGNSNSKVVKHTSMMLNTNSMTTTVNANISAVPDNTNTARVVVNTNTIVHPPTATVVVPIANFYSRVTKKPFGIYITPKTSPIQPEKFTGYHTGTDAETTPAEANVNVSVMAMAAGTVVFAGQVNGYGGVIIIRHTINGVKLLSLYGHLRITSFTVKVGTVVKPGQRISYLGTGYSSETDGERKHLHFGLIKGWAINYKGYVPTSGVLIDWYDPVVWLNANGG